MSYIPVLVVLCILVLFGFVGVIKVIHNAYSSEDDILPRPDILRADVEPNVGNYQSIP